MTIITVTRPAGVPVDWSKAIPAIASLFAGCSIDTKQGPVYRDTLAGSFSAIRNRPVGAGPHVCLSRNCDCEEAAVAATPEEDDQLEKDLGNAVGEKTGSAGVANNGHETKVKETKKK